MDEIYLKCTCKGVEQYSKEKQYASAIEAHCAVFEIIEHRSYSSN
jgi:hypothetical protein